MESIDHIFHVIFHILRLWGSNRPSKTTFGCLFFIRQLTMLTKLVSEALRSYQLITGLL